MRMIRIILIIIFFVPSVLSAHEGEIHLPKDPTTLPGESRYWIELVSEWIEVNIFTLSTKAKQQKKLDLVEERAVEISALLERKDLDLDALRVGLENYQKILRDVEYMTEKIIVLDGVEVGLAEELEFETSRQEEFFSQLLELRREARSMVLQALNAARIENQNIFEFMVKNYQSNDQDIEKHKNIIVQHADLANRLKLKYKISDRKLEEYLLEAEKFRKAGLNIQAYQLVNRAKNIVYSKLISSE